MELLKTCTVIYIIIQLAITISTTAPEESENSERAKSISQILEEDIEHVIGDGISGDIDPLGSVYHAEVEDKEKVGADESTNTENLRATTAPQTTTTTSTVTQSSTTTQSTPPNCVVSAKLNQTDKIIRNEVKLVNGSHLTRTLSDSATLECFLVLFYVPWCPFSARLAPLFNALPKAFPNLDILAFDVSKSVGYNTKFGTSAVPMVLLFQHKNVLAKFNYTEKNLTEFIEFVSLKTGFKGNKSVEIDEEDLVGPVPTVAQQRFDYFLFISWIFLIIVSIDYSIRKTRLRVYLMRWLRRLALWIRDIRYPVNNANNLPELDEPQRLQAIENAAINRQNENHLHFE